MNTVIKYVADVANSVIECVITLHTSSLCHLDLSLPSISKRKKMDDQYPEYDPYIKFLYVFPFLLNQDEQFKRGA